MKNDFAIKLNSFARCFAGICFLFLLLVTCYGIGYTVKNTASEQVTSLSEGWTDEEGNPFSLNTFQKAEETDTQGQKIYYTMPAISDNRTMIFRCRNMFVNIYVNDKLVYEDNKELHPIYGSSPGSRWHVLSLNSCDKPQTICIEGFTCYDDTDGLIDNIYYGRSANVYKEVVRHHFLSFFIGLFSLLIGIVLLILCIIFRSRRHMQLDLLYLGLGVFYASIWAITESLLCQLFFAHSEVIHLVTYTSLISIPLPFALLAALRFEGWKKRLSEVHAIINCINMTVITFLHITGIKEYHYTLTLTHILLAFLIPLLIELMLSYMDYKNKNKKTKYLLIPILIAIVLCLALALFEFLLGWFDSYSSYTQIAMIGFLSCLVFYYLHQMIDVLQKGMQADMMHNLALTDYLTGLYNRTALAEHRENYLDTMMEHCALGVIQFDVNNLKTVNDTLGHEKGDYMIQLVSEGLQMSFSEHGNCYRMGGDEFLVILTGKNPKQDYENGIQQLLAYCEAHNAQSNIDFTLEIAHGFVLEKHISLSEAIERADNLMYENKKKLKEADH